MEIVKAKSISIFIYLIIFTQLCFFSCSVHYSKRDEVNDLIPTIDFIQPWYTLDWESADWNNLIVSLKNEGYEALILQNTAVIEANEITENYYTGETSMVSKLLTAASQNNFKIYLGLGDDSSWWITDNYTDTAMQNWSERYYEIIHDLYTYKAEYSDTFVGYYFTFEMYTNLNGFETKWATLVNNVVGEINQVDSTMQTIFSPYNSNIYIMTKKQQYSMWGNFFKNTNLRENDIFAPQDGFGNCSVDYDAKIGYNVFNFLQATYTAATKYSKCKFGVNVEFFTKTENTYASDSRIEKQLYIANQFADEILSFSYSHYYYN